MAFLIYISLSSSHVDLSAEFEKKITAFLKYLLKMIWAYIKI